MKILALECSSKTRSVALVESTKDSHSLVAIAQEEGHERSLFALLDDAFAKASWAPPDITDLVIGLGPGSYTGIRSAIALAQGWSLNGAVRLHGVSSVETLAYQIAGRFPKQRLAIVTDAQRQEVYWQEFDSSGVGISPATSLGILSVEEARARAAGVAVVAGSEARRWFDDGENEALSAQAAAGYWLLRRANQEPEAPIEPIYLRETSFVKAPPPRFKI